MKASIQPTTAKTYQHHWQTFLHFLRAQLHAHPTFPADTNHICLFLVHLASIGLTHTTIRTYLTALSFVHKMSHAVDTTQSFVVTKTLQGIKNTQSTTSRHRMPITRHILHSLLLSLPFAAQTPYDKILWPALFLTTYHACLRAGEVTLSKNPNNVLQRSQVSTDDDHFAIQFLQYKHSAHHTPLLKIKRQPQGIPCPLSALQRYLAIRGAHPGQLFINLDKSPVTIEQFANILKITVSMCSLPTHLYTTHSFRIGKATDMASNGHPDQTIRQAGRWRSTAYNRYLRPENVTLPQ